MSAPVDVYVEFANSFNRTVLTAKPSSYDEFLALLEQLDTKAKPALEEEGLRAHVAGLGFVDNLNKREFRKLMGSGKITADNPIMFVNSKECRSADGLKDCEPMMIEVEMNGEQVTFVPDMVARDFEGQLRTHFRNAHARLSQHGVRGNIPINEMPPRARFSCDSVRERVIPNSKLDQFVLDLAKQNKTTRNNIVLCVEEDERSKNGTRTVEEELSNIDDNASMISAGCLVGVIVAIIALLFMMVGLTVWLSRRNRKNKE